MPSDSNIVQEKIDNLLNTSIIILTVVTVFAVSTSIYRAIDIGWQPAMYVHLAILLFLLGIAIFRKISSSYKKSKLPLGLFCLAGVVGTVSFGLVGNGILLLTGFVMLSVARLGIRAGVIATVFGASTVVIVGAFSVPGH